MIAELFLFTAAVVVVVLILAWWFGAFYPVDIKVGEAPMGKMTFAYKFSRGPYHQISGLFAELTKLDRDKPFVGIYYDDPRTEPPQRLRYVAAAVLAVDDEKVDEAEKRRYTEHGCNIFTFPRPSKAVHTSFPTGTWLSFLIAVRKVYPKMAEYTETRKLQAHPYLERCSGSDTLFWGPLTHQKEFYVPEALQAFPGEEPYEMPESS